MTDLAAPISWGASRSANRVALAPMTNKQSHSDGRLSDTEIAWLARRAKGGFGTIITGGYAVSPEGRVWEGQAGVYSDDHIAPLARLATALAPTSTPGIVQLIHGGSRFTPEIAHLQGISASAGSSWRSATERDIAHLLDAHRSAALRVQAAGLQGIEIHAAHGYLPAQFISPTQNTRTDQWGGDLNARARFLRTLVQTVRSAVGPDFIVGVRLSAEDTRRGITPQETAIIAGWIAQDGIDYLHLSLRNALATSAEPPRTHPIRLIRAAIPSEVRLVVAGRLWSPHDANLALARGADIVALGHAAIHHPDWPQDMADPTWTPTPPPTSTARLTELGVSDPFLRYLRENWPETVMDATSEDHAHHLDHGCI